MHPLTLAPSRAGRRADPRIDSFAFISLFLGAAFVQVGLLLGLAHWLARRAALADLDPDNHVVPYLTTVADVLGTALLLGIAAVTPT